jgi:hypothetical protein
MGCGASIDAVREPDVNPDGANKPKQGILQRRMDPARLKEAARKKDLERLKELVHRMPRAQINHVVR